MIFSAPKPIEPVVTDPCEGDPCGRYAQCKDMSGVAACSCLPGYVGTPPNCRPECVIHSECPSNKACINEKCRDPCPGACGAYAECSVIQHNAVCRCQHGYEGDAFSACRRITTSEYSTFTFPEHDLATLFYSIILLQWTFMSEYRCRSNSKFKGIFMKLFGHQSIGQYDIRAKYIEHLWSN